MLLEEFVEKHPNGRHIKNYEEFAPIFKKEGCEMFLWKNFQDEKAAWEYTRRLRTEYGEVKINHRIEKFLEQFSDIDRTTEVVFFYQEDYSPQYLMVRELCKKAKRSFLVNNIFDEDDTLNHVSVFDKTDTESVGILYRIIYGYGFGGYKLFGKGLKYFRCCLQYDGHMLKKCPDPLAHFLGDQIRSDIVPELILEARRQTNMIIRQQYFKDEFELFENLTEYLMPFFQELYIDAREVSWKIGKNWKKEIEALKSQLVADGIIVSKWKNEQALFKIVKKIYPDALFQYRPRWLEPQNVDIYIPSINVAIEYQGIQHYEAVDFFGGDEALVHRQALDNRKKKLCNDNKMKLLEWKYTEEVSEKAFKNKISVYL